ncbi:hypothetical protein HOP50_02g17060 [Chloropicon primus]|nr:hypothetical protein HOP50_02g17060 [Chloropicon primus]
MRAARLARSTDVVSYEVRKSAIDVIAENAWWLAALLVLVGCLYTVAEESRTRWLPFLFIYLVALLCRTAVCERVVLFRGLGVQLESTNCLAARSRMFLEENDIESVLINEAVTTSDVYYYLCFTVQGSKDMAVGFPTFKPGVEFIAELYKEAKRFFPSKF